MDSRLNLLVVSVFCGGVAAGYLAPHRPERASLPKSASASLQSTGPGSDVGRPVIFQEPMVIPAGGSSDAAASLGGGELQPAILNAARQPDYFQRKHDLYDIALKLRPDEFAAALEAAESLPVGDRGWAQPTLIARWAEVAPDAAVAWVRALPASEHRDSLLDEAFGSLGLKDPATALRLLGTLGDESSRKVSRCRYELFRGWAQRDPVAAARQALSMKHKREQSSALSTSLTTWAGRDPVGAMQWASQISDPALKDEVTTSVLRPWAESDPEAVARHVLAIPEVKSRDQAISAVLNTVAVNSPDTARQLLAELPPGTARDNALSSLISNLGYQNPKVASEYALLLPVNRQFQIESVAGNYAREDVAGALQWAARFESDQLRERAISRIVNQWAEEAPQQAYEYAMKNAPNAVSNVLSVWAASDPLTAISKAAALPASNVRDNAIANCIGVMAQKDPQKALASAAQFQGDAGQYAVQSIVRTWADQDGPAAANWVLKNADSDGAQSTSLMQSLMSTWVRNRPVEAATWLQGLPAGSARESAVTAFASYMANSDPAAAADWAASLSNSQRRENAIRNVATEWLRQDKAAAIRWLKQVPAITEEARAKILQPYLTQ